MSVHRHVHMGSVWPGLMDKDRCNPTPNRSHMNSDCYVPKTPMARPPKAIPMALPLSSSSVYTLASIPIPKEKKS